jgi:ATP-dependent Clp protease ATP-binding subunit ClpX
VPSDPNIAKVVIDENTVNEGKEPLLVYREAAKSA